jgi:hypothetical protein
MKRAKMNPKNANPARSAVHPDGLDKWNERLDHNLEAEKEGDPEADEQAKDYSEKYGSGDQSDDH